MTRTMSAPGAGPNTDANNQCGNVAPSLYSLCIVSGGHMFTAAARAVPVVTMATVTIVVVNVSVICMLVPAMY